MQRLIRIAAAVALVASPAAADSLREAMATAYASNPNLISARAALRAVDEGVPTARAGMRPQVSANLSVGVSDTSIRGAASGGTNDQESVSLDASQVLYDFGRTYHAIEGAVADVNATRSRLYSTEQTVLFQVVTAYMDVRRDQQFVALAKNNIRLISEQLRAARDRFEVGEVTRTDVSQAEARLAQVQAELASRQGALARSIQAYRRVVGVYPGPLDPPPPLPPLPETLQDAVRIAMDNHPDLQAAQFSEQSARAGIAAAQSELLPRVSLSGSLSYSEGGATISSGITSASIRAQVTVPLYQGGRAYSGVRRAQANQSARMADIHAAARSVREAVENAWSDLSVTRVAIAAGRKGVKAAQLAFEGVREEAKLGARTTIDVLDAEQDLLDARTSLVASQRDEYVAGYALLAAMGRLTAADQGLAVDLYDPSVNYEDVNDKWYGFTRDELTTWEKPYRP